MSITAPKGSLTAPSPCKRHGTNEIQPASQKLRKNASVTQCDTDVIRSRVILRYNPHSTEKNTCRDNAGAGAPPSLDSATDLRYPYLEVGGYPRAATRFSTLKFSDRHAMVARMVKISLCLLVGGASWLIMGCGGGGDSSDLMFPGLGQGAEQRGDPSSISGNPPFQSESNGTSGSPTFVSGTAENGADNNGEGENTRTDTPQCTPGALSCEENQLTECNEGGTGSTVVTTCGEGTACNAEKGECVCAPHCADAQCGDDGCGGTCGECPGKQTCQSDGSCATPACSPQGTGSTIGTQIKNLSWQESNGETLELHSFCSAKEAIVLIQVAGW